VNMPTDRCVLPKGEACWIWAAWIHCPGAYADN
jgi:hypothetical protein